MRRFIIGSVLAAGAIALLPTLALADGAIVVTPGDGSQDDTFTFVGSGFAPSQQISELFVSPAGEQFTLQIDGAPAVLVATGEGTFATSVFPRKDFADAQAGDWIVRFCEVDTGTCYSTTIHISI